MGMVMREPSLRKLLLRVCSDRVKETLLTEPWRDFLGIRNNSEESFCASQNCRECISKQILVLSTFFFLLSKCISVKELDFTPLTILNQTLDSISTFVTRPYWSYIIEEFKTEMDSFENRKHIQDGETDWEDYPPSHPNVRM